MTRIIAGSARGRRLQVPAAGTRPTTDRVREAMFSTLESMLRAEGRPWAEVTVLDLYAGSGALGLEALSRGAASAVLIERDRPAADRIRRNAADLGLDAARVIAASVDRLSSAAPLGPACGLVLADPPYAVAASTIRARLTGFATHGWLEPSAIVVVERPASVTDSPLPEGWTAVDQRRYGDTVLWYGRVQPA